AGGTGSPIITSGPTCRSAWRCACWRDVSPSAGAAGARRGGDPRAAASARAPHTTRGRVPAAALPAGRGASECAPPAAAPPAAAHPPDGARGGDCACGRAADFTHGGGRGERVERAAREVHVLSDLQRTALGAGSVDVPGVAELVLAPPARVPANRCVAAARAGDGGLTIAVSGTPGASAAPLVARVQPPGSAPARAREVGRTLAAPGQSVTLPLPPLAPGWWIGEVLLDADELRGDDRRLFVV